MVNLFMNKQITHKQHYVQRKYLSLWTNDLTTEGFVLCEINESKPFPIRITNILYGNDFYRIPLLSYNEISFCKAVFSKLPTVDKATINKYITQLTLCRQAIDSPNISSENKKALKKELIQLGEDFQKVAEDMMSDSIRKKVLQCDSSFLEELDDEGKKTERYCFLAYVYMQYLRSPSFKKGISNNINAFTKKDSEVDGDKVWAVIHNVLATAMTNHMFFTDVKVRFLVSEQERFITCDCPVVRLDVAEDKTDRFYYPFSPRVAMIIGTNADDTGVTIVGEEEINYYNGLIRKKFYQDDSF